ncbi:MAG TPA: glycosyltransferase [Chloroflexi bacterium]|nr:glycosyltransferase [Chloroflexota bacterium]
MKILFLTPQLPYPPRQGAALRNWGFISQLAGRHEVAVLSFLVSGQVESGEDGMPVAVRIETVSLPTRSLGERLRDLFVTRQPDMALRLASERYARRLADWLAQESFDVVHVGGIEMSPYLDVLEATHPRPGILFDDLNCEYLLQRRAFSTDLRSPSRWMGAAYSWVQYRRLRRYEAQVCRRADRVVAVSDADAAILRDLEPGIAVSVVPNGVDTQVYRPQSQSAPRLLPESSLVFTGTMDFRPNVDAMLWFVRHVWPLIQAQVPDVHLFIVGQRPHRRLAGLRDDPALTLTGWVEDTRPYIGAAAVYVAPLRIGGGTRLKLLEALAMAKPVVATPLGAEGYPVVHGRELMLADTPADFAAAVVDLLRCPERRTALGLRGRAFVEQHYDWRAIVPRLEEVYASLS